MAYDKAKERASVWRTKAFVDDVVVIYEGRFYHHGVELSDDEILEVIAGGAAINRNPSNLVVSLLLK